MTPLSFQMIFVLDNPPNFIPQEREPFQALPYIFVFVPSGVGPESSFVPRFGANGALEACRFGLRAFSRSMATKERGKVKRGVATSRVVSPENGPGSFRWWCLIFFIFSST